MVANQIAKVNGREIPEKEDYLSALSVLCIWPPNKPPIMPEFRPRFYSTFYDDDQRAALRKAIGAKSFELPAKFYSGEEINFPEDVESYRKEILDYTILKEMQ